MLKKSIIPATCLLLLALTFRGIVADTDWPEYLGGPDRNHYSTLTQIDTNNVQKLQVAWSYSAPDTGQMQMNPIIVNGSTIRYFVCSSGICA